MLAVRTGLEPATPGVTGRYSNRLNYRTTLLFRLRTRQILRIERNLVNIFSSKISRLHSFSSGSRFILHLHYLPIQAASATNNCRPSSSPNPNATHGLATHLQPHKLFSTQMLVG